MEIRLDEATQTLEVDTGGAWLIDDTKRHMQRMRLAVDNARARYGRVKVLVDAVAGITQSPEALNYIQQISPEIYEAGDRVAILVSSSLMKLHSKRLKMPSQTESFISRRAATTWLQAYS